MSHSEQPLPEWRIAMTEQSQLEYNRLSMKIGFVHKRINEVASEMQVITNVKFAAVYFFIFWVWLLHTYLFKSA